MQRGKNYDKKGVSGVKLVYHWQGKNIMDFGSTADPDPFEYLPYGFAGSGSAWILFHIRTINVEFTRVTYTYKVSTQM
jgi:hypothetical protein